MRAALLVLILWPAVALAADGTDATYAGGAVVAAGASLVAGRRLKRNADADRFVQDHALKHGWDANRCRVERAQAIRRAVRKVRRAP